MDVNLDESELNKLFKDDTAALLVLDDEHFVEASAQALELIGVSSIEVLKSFHPAMISPEFQPDGQSSKLKANEVFGTLLNNTSIRFYWRHISIKGKFFDVNVTLRQRQEGSNKYIDVHWKRLD